MGRRAGDLAKVAPVWLIAWLAVGCGDGDAPRARIVLAGPNYGDRCESYTTCGGNVLGWQTERGVDVELDVAFLALLFGTIREESRTPTWASGGLPTHDATYDFSTDGGIVALPGQHSQCVIALGPRLCEPCRLRASVCENCSMPPAAVLARLDGVVVQWSLDLDAEVGPFPCELVPDPSQWITLQISPRRWFEDVTEEMLLEHDVRELVAPGTPLYDALAARIADPETFSTLRPE